MSYDLSLDSYDDMAICWDDGEGMGIDGVLLLDDDRFPTTTTGWDFFDSDPSYEDVNPLLLLIDASETICFSWLMLALDFAEEDNCWGLLRFDGVF